MFYVKKDSDGNIIAIERSEHSSNPADEEKSLVELSAFLSEVATVHTLEKLFVDLDKGMIRVVEDLVDILIQKKLIMLTDLPEEVRKKIFARKQVRDKLHELQIIVDDIV